MIGAAGEAEAVVMVVEMVVEVEVRGDNDIAGWGQCWSHADLGLVRPQIAPAANAAWLQKSCDGFNVMTAAAAVAATALPSH